MSGSYALPVSKLLWSSVIAAVVGILLSSVAVAPVSAIPEETPRTSARGYAATAHFGAPKPARIGSRCIYPKFLWMVATNAPAGAEFHGSATVTMGGKEYGSLPYPRLGVNRWNGVQMTRPVCRPGRYRILVRGIVTPVAYGVATNQIYAHVSGGATYVIR